MEITATQPIINGSANPRLTYDEFKSLDFEAKRRYLWYMLVSMEFANSFPEVDHRVFEHSPIKGKFTYNDLTEENVDELFNEIRREHVAHTNRLLNKTANLHFEHGKKIHEAQKEYGFGGVMELTMNKMQGYIKAIGSWNDYSASDVSAAVAKLHALAPRIDYGVNNPNTGGLLHKWKSVHSGEYLMMEFDFINAKDLERVKEFYKEHWQPKGRAIKADSIRFEEVDHQNGYFGIELIMWWD